MKYIIYKIQIKDYIYIGSTKDFTRRKSRHKRNCINGNEFLVYKTIRENGGWDCCTMVPVKEIEVETKIQAHIAEEEARVEYNAQMNSIRAYRSDSIDKECNRQYAQTEKHKQYQKQYRQTHDSKEYQKQYYLAKKAKLVESPEIKVEA
jgi:hypothetical protein